MNSRRRRYSFSSVISELLKRGARRISIAGASSRGVGRTASLARFGKGPCHGAVNHLGGERSAAPPRPPHRHEGHRLRWAAPPYPSALISAGLAQGRPYHGPTAPAMTTRPALGSLFALLLLAGCSAAPRGAYF